jgi:hypothetical protein
MDDSGRVHYRRQKPEDAWVTQTARLPYLRRRLCLFLDLPLPVQVFVQRAGPHDIEPKIVEANNEITVISRK